MISRHQFETIVKSLIPTMYQAGDAIMEIFKGDDVEVSHKADTSPVTRADQVSEAIIHEALGKVLPGVMVIAEEHASTFGLPDDAENQFLLVDPLDGTREFVKKGTDFTVNIALIQNGAPVFGLVYAPARDSLYYGFGPGTAQKIEGRDGKPQAISVRAAPKSLAIVASKSHRNQQTEDYLAHYPGADHVAIGSSLKFCLVAEGQADLYPRLGNTMEWDTGAGHAVLVAAGGGVFNPDGTPFTYGKPNFRNDFFVARGDANLDFVKF